MLSAAVFCCRRVLGISRNNGLRWTLKLSVSERGVSPGSDEGPLTAAQTIDGRSGLRVPVTGKALALGVGYAAVAVLAALAVLRDGQVRPEHAVSWVVIAVAV